MILRLLTWLAVVIVGVASASETQHPCPCILRTLCPHEFGSSPTDEKVTGPMQPCADPDTVHCCGTSVSLQEEEEPIDPAINAKIRKEEELMVLVQNAIERMNEQYNVEDAQREDKALGNTQKNQLGCTTKQCIDSSEKKTETIKERNTSFSSETGRQGGFNSSVLLGTSELSEVINSNGSVEKVFIVFAENPKNNAAYLGKGNKPQIVLPSMVPTTEVSKARESTTEEIEIETQESSIDPIQIEENSDKSLTETKSKLSRYHRKNQLQERKSNRLQKLFPKRRPPPHTQSKNSQEENENHQAIDDVEIAESNLDEVTDTDTFDDHDAAEDYPDDQDVYDEPVSAIEEFPRQGSQPILPANVQNETEQPLSRRLPQPPRRLNIPPARTEENKQTGRNALELLRRRSKGRNDQNIHKPSVEPMKITNQNPMEEQIAMVMDEINVKVINNMMKTNFTGRSTSRSNTALKSSRVTLKPMNNRITSSLTRNNQEQKNTESLPQSQRHLQTNQQVQQSQAKPQTQTPSLHNVNQEQSTLTQASGGLPEENKVHRFQLKPRPTLRSQNTKLPSKLSSPISMTQEQAFDTSRDTPNTQTTGRRQPFTRLRTRPPSTLQPSLDKTSTPETPQSTEDQTKPTTPFVRKRLPARERLRSRFETLNVNKNKQDEEQKESFVPETPKPNFKTSSLHSVPTNEELTTNNGESASSFLKSGQDLEGSGSDFDFQKFQTRGNGKFVAPQELETGFHPMPPMMESRELKVVGPLPGGFLDPASGLSDADDIGLELPQPNYQNQFKTEQNFNQNSRPSIVTRFNNEPNFNQNDKPLSLLPPVFRMIHPQVPPQTIKKTQFLPQFTETASQPFFEQGTQDTFESQDEGDLTQIQKQFSTLKSQYDMLLNRYAETLNIYIGQYKKLSNSTPPSIR